MPIDRRQFLRSSLAAALGGSALFSPLGTLNVLAAAAQPHDDRNDYRALVCVFLFGGNDSFNTVMPYSASHYADYRSSRQRLISNGSLAFEQVQIQAQALSPLADGLPSDDGSYGLHPAMAGLRTLFNRAGRPSSPMSALCCTR